MKPVALGLDLGSTFVKAAAFDAGGRLSGLESCRAPELRGEQGHREGDAEAYVAVARELLERVGRGVDPRVPLGIASQRSTFVVWDPLDRKPAVPMVSWQDTRGAGFSASHRDLEPTVLARTGLPLSAHYLGPKLAAAVDADPTLGERLRGGELRVGTLETFLLSVLSEGDLYETDPTMAARTAMMDLADQRWSKELLASYGLSGLEAVLPAIRPTRRPPETLPGGRRVTVSVADQAAGALAVLDPCADGALINLGTGGFVLRNASGSAERRPGYLTASILGGSPVERRWALEGAIGGAGAAVDRFGRGPTPLPRHDPSPDAFALPDVAGLGSPHWRPEIRLTLSTAARTLPAADQRRVVLEGLLFRVREVIDGLFDSGPPERTILSGGLARDPFVACGLAALTGRRVERLEMTEGILTGAARLAGGLPPYADPAVSVVAPAPAGGYLAGKYPRWQAWLSCLLGRDDSTESLVEKG